METAVEHNKLRIDLPKKILSVDTVVCVVVYSKEHLIGIKDILDSICLYMANKNVHVMIVDTSMNPAIHLQLKKWEARYQSIPMQIFQDRCTNVLGKFYYMSTGYMKYAVEHFRFKSYLRLDPDAMITGYGLLDDISDYFGCHPNAGSLGSYKYNCKYERRDFRNWEYIFAQERGLWGRYVDQLQKEGYILGEHVQAGAEIYSYNCLKKLNKLGLLQNEQFRDSRLVYDVIISLLVRWSGYEMCSFVDDGLPLAIAYKGLPLTVRELRQKNKKLIHSVKFSFREMLIRSAFRCFRYWDSIKKNEQKYII